MQQFAKYVKEGHRIYSGPWNTGVHERYNTVGKAVIVAIDIYCGGTIVANSGSQRAGRLRVRLSNLRGRGDECHDVCIAPCSESHTTGRRKGELRRKRIPLFQIYIILSLHDLIAASQTGIVIGDIIVLLQIAMTVADQTQEHSIICLKSADSHTGSTLCTMPFNFKSENDKEHVEKIQQSKESAPNRDFEKTVWHQLLSSRQRLENAQPTRRLSPAARAVLEKARHYLTDMSAQEYPPALVAFGRLSSEPHFLYIGVGFDTLHVLDQGIHRILPDTTGELLGKHVDSLYSATESLSLANQRIRYMAENAEIPRISPFIVSPSEKRKAFLVMFVERNARFFGLHSWT
ncbi:unnamed protein product [Agarophyton chilense]